MHHQYRLLVLQWNPGTARRNPTRIVAATYGRFHAVILQEASDHVPNVTDQFIAYTGSSDLAILLNRDTFEPNPAVFAFQEASSSKDTWVMVILIVRDAHMTQYDVDFIGGDFNMSAFTHSFRLLATRSCGVLVPWKTQIASALGFSSCPSARMSGVWIHTAAANSTTRALGPPDTTAHFPVFLHLRTTDFPGPDSITRSEQAWQRRLERTATQHERRQCHRKLNQPSAS